MKFLFLACLLFSVEGLLAQKKAEVGPPNNVGREYGNPKMPFVVSHLAGANKTRLERANKNSRHSIFSKVLCFRKLCRIQSGHSASLHAIRFNKFKKKIARNAKRGAYKKAPVDSTRKRRPAIPVVPVRIPVIVDTTQSVARVSVPAAKADSLIVLGGEVLFETNKSTLMSEHFVTLNSIVDFLVTHPTRSVRISGHTDNTGNESHNLTLSQKRADVVAEYLVDNGVAIKRVESTGMGSSKPIAPNTTDEGRKKNRRVEVLIHDGR